MLIKPVYSGTIDTPEDMLESSAQLAVLRGSAHAVSLKEDPRPAVQRLYEGHIVATIATKHGLVIPDYLKEGLDVHFAENFETVYKVALGD